MISDHALVKFTLRARKSATAAQYVDRRAWRRLSRDEFAADVIESRLCRDLNELEDLSVDDLVRLYDQQMTRLLDKHCPLIRVSCRSQQAHHGLPMTAGPHDDAPEPPKDVSDAHSLTMTNASGLNG